MIDPNMMDLPLNQVADAEFKQFFDDLMGDDGIKEQSVVKGTVIRIDGDWVTVDISYKAEGLVPAHEFKTPEGELTIAVGDEVDVYLPSTDSEDGMLVLSKERADLMKAWDEIS